MRRGRARIISPMQERASRVALLLMLGACLSAFRSPAAACGVKAGEAVVLASQDLDPDVFLWDSRDRLVRYAEGDYTVDAVLKHTTLIRAYSRAIVVACRNAGLRPPYAASADPAMDLVGVRVTSGGFRGHYGWVLSADVRRPGG
jgi:hypothetical protein